jgi:hypothetical protein
MRNNCGLLSFRKETFYGIFFHTDDNLGTVNGFLIIDVEDHPADPAYGNYLPDRKENTMADEQQIQRELMADLLARLSMKSTKGRETAIEALAVITEDETWRADELIRQGGIEIVRNLLREKNPHIVLSALEVITAVAASGEEEALISDGVIACLDTMQDHKNPAIKKKVQEALALLQPEVEEIVAKPDDDY